MDYEKYDRLQIDLGGIKSDYEANIKAIFEKSTADKQTKELVQSISEATANSLNALALCISETLIAASH